MWKLLRWLDKNILKIGISFLLFFIPLYPKLPLIDIRHTWVYIRLEDIFIALLVLIFVIQSVKKKAIRKTPLSLPIFLYWLIGGLSLIFAVFILRPHLPNFFPWVAFLHFLRRIEYMILFFIVFSTVKSVKDVRDYLAFFFIGVIGVLLYGFGQKFLRLPAFLTMNEEFSKGIPLFLPREARATSTFAGHYDLAAYLVFVLSLSTSLFFGFKKIWSKLALLIIIFGAYFLLLFTASRISFAVYLVAVSLVLLLQRKKWLIIPVIVLSLFLMKEFRGVSIRYGKTFRIEQVVYDVKTGKPVATLEEFLLTPTPSVSPTPAEVVVKKPPEKKEDLPLGSGFLEVPLLQQERASPAALIVRRTTLNIASEAAHLATISGDFLVKRAIVYDIASTTRFQGTWPRAIQALKRNLALGSGYSSISLATDNSYLRALGETGILGLSSFLFIFFVILLISRQCLGKMRLPFNRSVAIGITGGIFGLSLNAILIDIFEASKVAYILWMMVGILVGLFSISVKRKESLNKGAINFIQEPVVAFVLLISVSALVFYSAISYYFTADDFTWLKWAAQAKLADLQNYFLDAKGFFYRPLIRIVFYLGHLFLGLKPYGYHLLSFSLHTLNSIAVYLMAILLTGSNLVAFLSGLFFLLHPIHAETVFWISQYSGILTAFFYFSSFLGFIKWAEEKQWFKWLCYGGSLLLFALALCSYELAVTLPLVLLLYLIVYQDFRLKKGWLLNIVPLLPYFILLDLYLWTRNIIARAHPLSGDYSYNLKNFVFNFFGNLIGYFGEMIAGLRFIPFYDQARVYFRLNKNLSFFLVFLGLVLLVLLRRKRVKLERLTVFSLGWFVIALLPVLGLGNIAERYLYLASAAFVIMLSFFLRKIYQRLMLGKDKGTQVVITLLASMIISGLAGFYYQELKKVEATWKEAGETANKILRALSTNYEEFPSESTLYFVNLPLRIERAWVFPVGIEDGLWFIYRDESLKVIKGNDLEAALDFKAKNAQTHVFVYEEGQLEEVQRVLKEEKSKNEK